MPTKKWSKKVTEESHAVKLDEGVFTWKSPHKIAESLLKSARNNKKRKGTVYQSAMSMLNFYINRGGNNISSEQKQVLEKTKDELREIFNRSTKKRPDDYENNQRIYGEVRKRKKFERTL